MPEQSRLSIIVPYRDRPDQLASFVPHLCAYFSRDLAGQRIPVELIVVEQAPGGPFNRGMLKNIGFILARERCDYVCFHDVDYLPIWPDYSPCYGLTGIAWYGSERRPLGLEGDASLREDMPHFFGGVVMADATSFQVVNGYANDYWGWGFEDKDLLLRYRNMRLGTHRRRGTFHTLPHANHGFAVTGEPSPDHLRNRDLYWSRWKGDAAPPPRTFQPDGLTNLKFEIIRNGAIESPECNDRNILLSMVTVALPPPPDPAD